MSGVLFVLIRMFILTKVSEAGEMTQQFRRSRFSSRHPHDVHNLLELQSQGSSALV